MVKENRRGRHLPNSIHRLLALKSGRGYRPPPVLTIFDDDDYDYGSFGRAPPGGGADTNAAAVDRQPSSLRPRRQFAPLRLTALALGNDQIVVVGSFAPFGQ